VKIQIFGMGCAKCALLEQHAREAVSNLKSDATVEKVTDIGAIAAMGVMSTPALAIDGAIRSAGRVLTTAQIEALISDATFIPR